MFGSALGGWVPAFTALITDGIEARPRARHLIGEIDRPIAAHEVLVPSHPPVGRRLPRLAAQTAAVHHHHRQMAIAVRRNLVLHVHLVDGDVAAAEPAASATAGGAGSAFFSPPTKKLPWLASTSGFLRSTRLP